MEKLLLRALLPGYELNVVYEEDIAAEPVSVPEFLHFIRLDAVDDLVCEVFGRNAAHPGHVRCGFDDVISYRVYEVCFSEAHAAVYKQRVIRLAGFSCDSGRCRVRELIARPDNEPVEGIVGVKRSGEKLSRSRVFRLPGLVVGSFIVTGMSVLLRNDFHGYGFTVDFLYRIPDEFQIVVVDPVLVELASGPERNRIPRFGQGLERGEPEKDLRIGFLFYSFENPVPGYDALSRVFTGRVRLRRPERLSDKEFEAFSFVFFFCKQRSEIMFRGRSFSGQCPLLLQIKR